MYVRTCAMMQRFFITERKAFLYTSVFAYFVLAHCKCTGGVSASSFVLLHYVLCLVLLTPTLAAAMDVRWKWHCVCGLGEQPTEVGNHVL